MLVRWATIVAAGTIRRAVFCRTGRLANEYSRRYNCPENNDSVELAGRNFHTVVHYARLAVLPLTAGFLFVVGRIWTSLGRSETTAVGANGQLPAKRFRIGVDLR